MEWRDKTWSNETCFTTARFITPLFYHSTPDFIVCHFYYGVDHHSLWLYVLLFPGSTKWCHLFPNYFFFLLVIFFSYFLFVLRDRLKNVETHLTLDKKGMVLAHVLPLGRPTTKLTRRGIRSVDKLLNGYALPDLQRFLKTRELSSSKANWSLRFSLLSINLADLLGQRTLLKRVQKVNVCDLWLADFHPFCLFLRFKVRCLWS